MTKPIARRGGFGKKVSLKWGSGFFESPRREVAKEGRGQGTVK